jgi:hypothetical protein
MGRSIFHRQEAVVMSNRQVLGFLHELRGRTMPVYHTRPADEV